MAEWSHAVQTWYIAIDLLSEHVCEATTQPGQIPRGILTDLIH